MSPKLTAKLWVDAYLTRMRLEGIPVFVLRHGDDVAGEIMVKLNPLDRTSRLFQRRFDFERDGYVWDEIMSRPETEIDAALSRMALADPDLWALEVEDREGRSFLDEMP